MIGKPLNKGLPRRLSVLLTCDYNNYRVGDTLTITTAAQNSVYKKAPHNFMYIVRHKKIDGEDYTRIVGD
jgi:hypothetical protein